VIHPDDETPGTRKTERDEFGGLPVSLRVMTDATFQALTDPYRRELQLHCYRMLGSVQDAEDVLQETLLAAWRGLEGFEERASLRAWLYKIATNRCLNWLRDAKRRPRTTWEWPAQPPEPTRRGEPLWLEPYPDVLIEDTAPGPEARYETREAVALAFVTGLQHLPPRQRAVLVLRDVLGLRAGEVADTLDSTEASVNSALQRARAALVQHRLPGGRERAPLPDSPQERELVGRFADAFESGDLDGLVALLTDDALLTMPPEPLIYEGPAAIREFFSIIPAARGFARFALVPTRANGQPAFAYWTDASEGVFVLTLEGERVAGITRFGVEGVREYFPLRPPPASRGA
jgi:RNA polymerase sigma-70 factor (ECF subfamily)